MIELWKVIGTACINKTLRSALGALAKGRVKMRDADQLFDFFWTPDPDFRLSRWELMDVDRFFSKKPVLNNMDSIQKWWNDNGPILSPSPSFLALLGLACIDGKVREMARDDPSQLEDKPPMIVLPSDAERKKLQYLVESNRSAMSQIETAGWIQACEPGVTRRDATAGEEDYEHRPTKNP